MSSTQWRPIAVGVAGCTGGGSILINFQDDAQTITVDSEIGQATCQLPEDMAVCLRSGDEPITAEALEAAGWEYRTCDDEAWYSHPDYEGHENVYITVEPYEGSFGVFVGQDADAGGGWNPGFRFRVPGCTTMTQLAQLVDMLGGEA